MIEVANDILTTVILWMTWTIFALMNVVGFFTIAWWFVDKLIHHLGMSKLLVEAGMKVIREKRDLKRYGKND